MLPFSPFSALTSKIFGGLSLALLIAVALMYWRVSTLTHERDELRDWKHDVVMATRKAAHRDKLGEQFVADQVRILGETIDNVRSAQELAVQQATAAKQEQERRDRERKQHHDDSLPAQIDEARRRSRAYIATHGVRSSGPASTAAGVEGPAGHTDLPVPTFATEKPDGPDQGPEFVVVPAAYLDACDVVTARLHNAQDWALDHR